MPSFKLRCRTITVLTLAMLLTVACAPAAPPSPTAAPPKPTEAPKPAAPAKPTEAPVAKPAEKPAVAASPAIKPADKPGTVASPAAKPADKPAAKPAFDEKAVADFYRGKTVKFLVGFSAGGTIDLYARMLARHMPKYIPGTPAMIVENRGGAGSRLAANAAYTSEAKDGTVIASFQENLPLLQAMGSEGIQFDALKFQWLGSAEQTTSACMVRTNTGINNIVDSINGREIIVAAGVEGSSSFDVPAVLNAALGTRLKIVPGYPGSNDMKAATERNETDGYCITLASLLVTERAATEGPNPSKKFIVTGGANVPDLPFLKGVPAAESLAKTDEGRQLIQAVDGPARMSKPYAVAPEVPRDRVLALRSALAQALVDPQLLAEAKQANTEPGPRAAEEVEQMVRAMLSLPPNVIDKLKAALAAAGRG